MSRWCQLLCTFFVLFLSDVNGGRGENTALSFQCQETSLLPPEERGAHSNCALCPPLSKGNPEPERKALNLPRRLVDHNTPFCPQVDPSQPEGQQPLAFFGLWPSLPGPGARFGIRALNNDSHKMVELQQKPCRGRDPRQELCGRRGGGCGAPKVDRRLLDWV